MDIKHSNGIGFFANGRQNGHEEGHRHWSFDLTFYVGVEPG
jgi:hypothetical protein